jgi:hypothetical protein
MECDRFQYIPPTSLKKAARFFKTSLLIKGVAAGGGIESDAKGIGNAIAKRRPAGSLLLIRDGMRSPFNQI